MDRAESDTDLVVAAGSADPPNPVDPVDPVDPADPADPVDPDGYSELPDRLREAVDVVDRLRSPGGCPWHAQQTHETLARYLIEEAHEAVEAIEGGSRAERIEELGDVLFQVLLHARLGQEEPDGRFDIDEVAGRLADKLRRRHPHVFGDAVVTDVAQVEADWDRLKAAEKATAGVGEDAPADPLSGVPAGLPSLARAVAVVTRLRRSGRGDLVGAAVARGDLGARLLALVAEADTAGIDADAALRRSVRELVDGARRPVPDADQVPFRQHE